MPSTASPDNEPKTAAKYAISPRSGARIPLGNHPGNTGGKKGRSGRPPAAFKDFLAKLRKDPLALEALERAARDEASKGFSAVWKMAAEYDTEKPAERKELSGNVAVTVRVAREGRRITAG